MLTVHLRINDEATKRPTPVRLRITDAAGQHYAPFGRVTEFATGRNEDVGGHLLLGRERYCYIDGSCEIRLPAGVPLRLQATKGPEYEAIDETVTLGPGQITLRFSIRRWSDLRAEGWFSGDGRVHFLTPHSAALEAAAEDIAVVNLLACVQPVASLDGQLYPSLPNITAFSGQQPALATEAALVAVNTLNVHPVLGSLGLLHCHRTVYPLTFGPPDSPDDWSLCDWCDQCHRKKGLTVWVKPFDFDKPGGASEALVALLLGKIDAVEFDAAPRQVPLLRTWYQLLEAGFTVPLLGSSGKDSNTVALGARRSYARLQPGEPLTYTNWINAVRAGRTFVTTGPLLRLEVNGVGPGETVVLPSEETRLMIRARVESRTPFDRLEILANNHVLASTAAQASDSGRWTAAVELESDGRDLTWIVARCGIAAHTSPVHVQVPGRPPRSAPTARKVFRQLVEQTRTWIEEQGQFTEEKWKRHLLTLCDLATAQLAESPPP